MDILLGILAVIIGAAVCLIGLRLFFLLLPIWGFVVGFLGGAALVTWLFGDGFLSTTLGIVVGIVLGIVGALISYFFWYFGVILAALIFNFPIYLVIVNTALAGATVVVGGVLLIFNKIDRADIGTTATWQHIHDHWLLWAVIAAIGIGSQLTMVQNATLPDEKWTRAPATV